MAELLNSEKYAIINDEINTILSSTTYSGVNVTIYTDSEQLNIATDEHGPIQNRAISQISNTLSYTDNNGQTVPPTITLNFTDGTSVTEIDGVNKYWYTLSGIVFVPRIFQTINKI
jgi:hypothetical protein